MWNYANDIVFAENRRNLTRRLVEVETTISSKCYAKMESCFPPLASLSLRSKSNANKAHKNRHSTGGTPQQHPQHGISGTTRNHNEFMPKLEVLQDLDLYYIRQIASSLKVNLYAVRPFWSLDYVVEANKSIAVQLLGINGSSSDFFSSPLFSF